MLPALAVAMLLQPKIVIDDFESVSQWRAMPSDDVSLTIGQDEGVRGKSIRIDFDFHGHGGYAVIRRDVELALPANYEFSWSIRGDAPVNTLEFKLVDPSGDNVWWSNQPGFVFQPDWRRVVRKKRHITFAWGPAGGGQMKEVAGIEIAITAGTGGKGTVWIDELELTPLEPDAPYNLTPAVSSLSALQGFGAARALDGDTSTSWRGAAGRQHVVDVDFQRRREFGGLVIDWERGRRPRSYSVSTSTDGTNWGESYSSGPSSRDRDYLYLPESDARHLRITLEATPGVVGLREITVQPLAWSATLNDFFAAVSRDAPAGSYPRYYSDRQSYWTVIGVSGDTREGMMDEEGLIESGKGQFSIEPFISSGGRLLSWNDVARCTGAIGGDLPIPMVTWTAPGLEMTITSFAAGPADSSVLYARYRLRNLTASPQRTTLYLAIRPFQVNPPWQFLNTQGGWARIDSVSYDATAVRVNHDRSVIPLTRGARFGAVSFDEGNIVELLRQSRFPTATGTRDVLGRASGALAWDIQLAPGGDSTIDVAIPLHASPPSCARANRIDACRGLWTSSQQAEVEAIWREQLGRVEIVLPESASHFPRTVRANLAYILINRDGPAIQPGSRSYERSWIRDGSLTSAALLRLGQYREVREFIDWYAKFQFDNGKIPCCVDSRGADPVPENDSHGQFVYLVAEYYRHTADRDVLARMWPNVTRAVAFMDSLRQSRQTEEFSTGEKRVFYGLMPQSISHEGYSAKPMHSYWDDFFALRGFKDATEIARILGKAEAARYATITDEFRRDFYASIGLSMKQHGIDYIPGAAELGDFDATSTTVGVNPAGELARLPQPALARTFEKYLENFRSRRDSA
ncbi:MAG: discoidin domain-containing protein, partial [Gemmatimonadaceae bacterium]